MRVNSGEGVLKETRLIYQAMLETQHRWRSVTVEYMNMVDGSDGDFISDLSLTASRKTQRFDLSHLPRVFSDLRRRSGPIDLPSLETLDDAKPGQSGTDHLPDASFAHPESQVHQHERTSASFAMFTQH